MSQRRAFTLVELLVVVALVALIATITAVALRPIRATAKRTDSMNALRQMVLGYNAYASDNNGALLPGYVSPSRLDLLGLRPKLHSGEPVDPGLVYGGAGASTPSDASSYVWRLAPYLDDTWKTMFLDYASGDIVDVLSSEVNRTSMPAYGEGTATSDDLGAGRVPSFGMNSVFVGGDDQHGGAEVADRNPWDPALGPGDDVLAATRLSEAKSPSRLIVFAPSRYPPSQQDANLPAAWSREREILGSPEIRPPFLSLNKTDEDPTQWFWEERQWHIEDGSTVSPGIQVRDVTNSGDGSLFDFGGGWPVVRWGDQIPVGRLDGSVTSFEIERLYIDMRMWSPFETGDHKVQ